MIDPAALREFLHAAEPRARGLAGRLLGSDDAVEPVVHEAMATAARRMREVTAADALEPWLRAIVARECYRHVARQDRWAWFGPGRTSGPSADGAAAEDQGAKLHAAVARLDPRARIAWSLRFQRGWSSHEIADALGLGPDEVSHGLADALGEVRRQVERAARSSTL